MTTQTAGTWVTLPRGTHRTRIGHMEGDAWPTGNGARFTLLDTETGQYIDGGETYSLGAAKGTIEETAFRILRQRN